MKLMELITPAKDIETPIGAFVKGMAYEKDKKLTYKGKNIEILGAGIEGTAYRLEDNPNVIKVMTSNKENLGKIPYLQYILTLSKYAKENPYFPRVDRISEIPINPSEYNVVINNVHEKNPDVAQKFARTFARYPLSKLIVFKMEPLVEFSQATREELLVLFQKMFGTEPTKQLSPNELREEITKIIEKAVHGKYTADYLNQIKDPYLKNAISLIKKVRAKTKAYVDIHRENVMLRRTPYGLQLVITDPLV
ncbi:MAG: hypothetical protein QXL17_02845 [Candidatus Thermoplasmatota archaeon]